MKHTECAIGIDIGGTNTVFGVVDAAGNILEGGSFPTAQYPDFDEFMKALAEAVDALVEVVEKRHGVSEVSGIGIGAPNANSHGGTIEHAPNLPWKETVPFIEKCQRYFPGMPVRIANDADAAALGEKIYGAAQGMNDFIVITLGTGLGSGLIAGGKLLTGRNGFAGELGHVTVVPRGRMCGCGRRGCLETYVSATGICRTVLELLAESTEPSELRSVAPDRLTALRITEAAEHGDKIALKAYEYTGKMLGRTLANTVLITGPEAIFLFGGLAGAGELIFGPTRKHLAENLLKNFQGKVKLLPSGIPEGRAAVLGAAALIRHEF